MKKEQNKKGFALMYAVIIVSIISVIAFGLASITYKQKVLSSLASDSQVAFYMADSGMECALFNRNNLMSGTQTFNCFSVDINNFGRIETLTKGVTTFLWSSSKTKEPCYSIERAQPGILPANPRPSFVVRGYNTCQQNPNRFVERTLRAYF